MGGGLGKPAVDERQCGSAVQIWTILETPNCGRSTANDHRRWLLGQERGSQRFGYATGGNLPVIGVCFIIWVQRVRTYRSDRSLFEGT